MAVLVAPASEASQLRRALEALGFFDATRRIAPVPASSPPSPTSYVGIPVDAMGLALLSGAPAAGSSIPEEVRQRLPLRTDLQLPPSAKARASGEESEQGRLAAALLQLRPDLGSLEAAATEAPQGWERHGDLVLLPDAALGGVAVREPAAGDGAAGVDGGSPGRSATEGNAETEAARQWQALGQARWRAVADALRCQRVALKGRVAPDGVRHSGARLVLGEDGWVRHVDNGVVYTWDVTRCMFSRGNITEKLRVAALPCAGETVVDLYAGIGYFTLPYLVHAGASHVYACEWNPEAVAALRQNLVLNKVAAQCTILKGDNAAVAPTHVADRVNLGLIPTSAQGWPVAVRCLKSSGGWLHVHENVTTTPPETNEMRWRAFGEELARELKTLLQAHHGGAWTATVAHIERVKSYAPRIYHMVYDIECRPVTPR